MENDRNPSIYMVLYVPGVKSLARESRPDAWRPGAGPRDARPTTRYHFRYSQRLCATPRAALRGAGETLHHGP